MAAQYKSRVKRKIALAMMDNIGTVLFVCYNEYTRALRWYSAGLTEKERLYFQKRCITLKEVADDMSTLRKKIYDDVKMW